MKIWNDEEVKSLFAKVENCKKKQLALRHAFIEHAKLYNREPNSVRNYYYHEVDNLCADFERAKRLNINLKEHDKSHFISFAKVQEEELFENIEKRVQDGQSVRSACLELSGGNLSLMTRLQNKYQNMKRKVDKRNNIIPFKQHTLTDDEINSLFMGLVRLIKKTAKEEAQPNLLLKKTCLDLKEKNMELENLKSEFEKLKEQNRMLLTKLEQSKKDALAMHMIKNRTSVKEQKI